jgi:hypothetical protein
LINSQAKEKRIYNKWWKATKCSQKIIKKNRKLKIAPIQTLIKYIKK